MKTKEYRHFRVRSRRMVLPTSPDPVTASFEVNHGKIVAVTSGTEGVGKLPEFDFGDSVVMAGLVDTHAHINEPGRTEWEGFETATRAAAAGGVTTVVDMPLNSVPPTTHVLALKEKTRAAAGKCAVDYGFWGGLVPDNFKDLEPLVAAGVRGCKAFLCESGVDEFPMAREPELRAGMKVLAKCGVPLLVHGELCSTSPQESGNSRRYGQYLASRPPEWEVQAARLMIRLARETGCAVHIVHLSAGSALEDLSAARREGLPITVETCPHYLTLKAEDIADGATQFKCAPPIRETANQERLWRGLVEGEIDLIVSDHSPCIPKLKGLETGDFAKAWGGIAGLQFSLPVVWTEMRRRQLGLGKLTQWMSVNTARLAGLESRKGRIAPGLDADWVVWDPEASFTVTADRIRHRHPVTPYLGKTLLGVVRKTFVRGHCVYEEGHRDARPIGKEVGK